MRGRKFAPLKNAPTQSAHRAHPRTHRGQKTTFTMPPMQSETKLDTVVEIDLVKYVAPTAKRWKYIALAVFVCASLAFGQTFLHPDSYMATATLAILKTRTDVQFDTRIKTVQPEDGLALLAEQRRNTLVGLAYSARIAIRVLDEFKDRLPSNTTAADLVDIVDASLMPKGDLLTISLTAQDPQLAADMTTYWAKELEKEANAVFSGVTDGYLLQISDELSRSKAELVSAQNNLEKFIRSQKNDSLRLTVNQKVRELDRLESVRLAPVLGSLQRTQASLTAVGTLSDLQQRARQVLTITRAMRKQLEIGGDAAASSNLIALVNLKLQVYSLVVSRGASVASLDMTTSSVDRTRTGEMRTNVEQSQIGSVFDNGLQIVMPSNAIVAMSADQQMRDIDGMIGALTDFDTNLTQSIRVAQTAEGAVDVPVLPNSSSIEATINNVVDELRNARADIESETQDGLQLTAERDTKLAVVQSLRSKLLEIEVASAVGNSQLRLAGEAVAPQKTVKSKIYYAAIGGSIGVGVGLLLALVLALRAGDFWRRPSEEA